MSSPALPGRPGPTICFIGVAGSAATTLSMVADELKRKWPEARLVVLDVERFNTQSTSSFHWPGSGEVLHLLMEQFGLANFSRRKEIPAGFNLLLNGGPFAYQRLVRRGTAFLRGIGADILITCNDTSYVEQAFLTAAKDVGASTVLIQEGPFTIVHAAHQGIRPGVVGRVGHLLRSWGILPRKVPYGSFGHDLVLACSSHYARRFEALGVAPADIRVTGVPRFDALAPAVRSDAQPATVLYVFQPFVWQGRVAGEPARAVLAMMAAGLNQAYERTPFDLILRQHPRSDPETLSFLESHLRIPFRYSPELPLPEVLTSCACVLGHYSVGLLESLILRTPVVCVPIPVSAFTEKEEGEKQAWFESTGVPCAYTPDDVSRHVLGTLQGNAVGDLDIDAEVGPLDRRALERTVHAIQELVGGRATSHQG
ncbi:hypothetical protein [Sphingomonas desiccabilis]|uniref:Uncharacterized protein n=1 Tax=Sphingomonas desiccabilis TaxID=429134 RepID=A0A4Q2J0B0_9SPHN|nr:hypothetical protein [Sphingomonas desiccabilis]MBB3909999.1 hypothetical protein [Sphingomonas desiccabilis]RXZ34702.1 hypothetical protein EO081_03265 [Sphingomonas desiccabilis]